MKTHQIYYDDRALAVAFPEGPVESSAHAHEVLTALHGLTVAMGVLFTKHTESDGYQDTVNDGLRGLQVLASLAVALDQERIDSEVAP